MNVSIRQDVKRTRCILWGVAVVLVLALVVYGGIRMYTRDTTWKPHTTWDGVPAVLDAAIRSSEYQEGGVYLSNPSLLDTASSTQRDAYSYRLAIDFLHALTPEQVESFQHEQNLPYTKLGPDQKRALMQLSASRVAGVDLSNAVNESFIDIWVIPTQQMVSFGWQNPIGNNQSEVYFHMTFSAKKAEFSCPYHHR